MFKTRIRELREQAGFNSQQAFADSFGVAQSTVGGWEAGKREPNYKTTKRLAAFFHVSIDYLIGLTDDSCFSGGPLAEFIKERRGVEPEESFAHRCGISVELLRRIEVGFRKTDTENRLNQINSLSTEDIKNLSKGLNVDWKYIAALYDGYNPHKINGINLFPQEDRTDGLSNQLLHDAKNIAKIGLSTQNQLLLCAYQSLNTEGQEKLLDYADDLVQSGKYIKSDSTKLGAAER